AVALAGVAQTPEAPGVLHCTNTGETTWFGLARAVFAAAGADPDRVRPTTSAHVVRPAPRPAYSVLGTTAWTAAGQPLLPPWDEAVTAAVRLVRA
ncbi:MAG: sugar nucleotide-binding protein, partial [Geodermatophilaceae bacterium]|nr:sugar nucleotide-binding protein [Geodermatophilaceae bacterium]